MNTGSLNRIISITTLTETVSSGDVTQVETVLTGVRAKVRQIDGSRFMDSDELKDKVVYELRIWDNASTPYSDNIKITYDSKYLYPIRPITRNPGTSNLNELIIIAATKKA